jgi:hypothetical protein
MKLSFIGVALGISIVIFWWLFSENLWKPDLIIKALFILLFLFIPWAIRGVISSGYIAYPIIFSGVHVDWKMPENEVQDYHAYTLGFSRTHLHGQAGIDAAYNYDWFPGWVKRMLHTVGFLLPAILFLGAFIAFKIKRINIKEISFILFPIFISMVFWFFTAPDIRYAVFTFWALGIAPLAYLISHIKINFFKWFGIIIMGSSVLIMLRNWNTDLQHLGDLPKQNFSVFTTKSGLNINVVKNLPPGDDWRICDCTIPCSVLPDSNVVLRGKNISEGFKIAKNK